MIPDSLLLILSGTVEHLHSSRNLISRYTAGSLIGECEVLNSCTMEGSYRTRTYIKALRLPSDLYVHALTRAGQVEKRRELLQKRRILIDGSFPGNVVSCPRLDMLADSLGERTIKAGRVFKPSADELYIVVSGTAENKSAGKNPAANPSVTGRQNLGPGDWINCGKQEHSAFKADSELTLAVLPLELVEEIPILSWTISEL